MPVNSCKKLPLKQPEILAIQRYLIAQDRWRDLSLCAFAVDSFLRPCDSLQFRVTDLLDGTGELSTRFRVRQRKTGESVECNLTLPTRQILAHWIKVAAKQPQDFLFTRLRSQTCKNTPISEVMFRLLVKQWVSAIGLNPEHYSTKSLRKARVRPILEVANMDYQVPQILLGHTDIRSTIHYADLSQELALDIAASVQFFEPLDFDAQKLNHPLTS